MSRLKYQPLRVRIMDAAQRMADAAGDMSKYKSERYYRAKDNYTAAVLDLTVLLDAVKNQP